MAIRKDECDLPMATSDEEVAASIEATITDIIHAVNTRNFSRNSSPWTSISPDFSMPSIAFRQRCTTRHDYINAFVKLATAYPKFKIEPLEMWTYVCRPAGYAELYLTAESSGGPTLQRGLKRKAIGRHEFRRIGGEWLLVGEVSILGIGDGVSVEAQGEGF